MGTENIIHCNRKDCQFYDREKNDCSLENKCNSMTDFSECDNYLISDKLINY